MSLPLRGHTLHALNTINLHLLFLETSQHYYVLLNTSLSHSLGGREKGYSRVTKKKKKDS